MNRFCVLIIWFNIYLHGSVKAGTAVTFYKELTVNESITSGPFTVTGKPIEVSVSFYIVNFEYVDEVKMEFSLKMYFRMSWNDPRLAYDPREYNEAHFMILPDNAYKNLWVPDAFFTNEVETKSEVAIRDTNLFRVNPNGNVYFVKRMSPKFYCRMQFQKFPFDSQMCGFSIESFRHNGQEVYFQWRKERAAEISDSVQINSYQLYDHTLKDCSKVYKGNLSFSCLDVMFLLKRNLGYYIILLFFPTTIVVVLSWMVMWLDPSRDIEKISLHFLLILTIMVQHSYLYQYLPAVSYMKSIDIWIVICEFSVFYAIIGTIIEKRILDQLSKRNTEQLQTRAKRINLSNKIALPLCFIVQVVVFGLLYNMA